MTVTRVNVNQGRHRQTRCRGEEIFICLEASEYMYYVRTACRRIFDDISVELAEQILIQNYYCNVQMCTM